MALQSGGGGGGKRRREDEEGGRGEAGAEAEAAKVDLLSALPNDVKLSILTFLPLKFAIRTSALSREWRHLWKCRWPWIPSSLEEHLRPYVYPSPQKLLQTLQSRRREGHRLDRFSLILATSTMKSLRFRRCLECVAACSAEDLHIELRDTALGKHSFHFPRSSPLLARLSLRCIGVSNLYYRNARPFPALEVIQLHSVPIQITVLSKMVALCPSLRVLNLRHCNHLDVLDLSSCNGLRVLDLRNCDGLRDLRYCDGLSVLDLRYCNDIRSITLTAAPNLRSLTIAECDRVTKVDVVTFSNLRSFRYSGAFISNFYPPGDASFADLYICYRAPILQFNQWFKNTPPNLSTLNVLTICSNALQIVSALSDAGAHEELAKLNNFQSLRELQLLMFEMKAVNLANIYAFLKNCHCPNLERLFVQLPTISNGHLVDLFDEVGEEPSEDDLENLMVVKILNFNWNRIEVQLVSFLLRKASSLRTLLLVSPYVLPSNVPGIQQADLLLLEEAVTSGQIILSGSDDAAIRPFHSEVFAKFYRTIGSRLAEEGIHGRGESGGNGVTVADHRRWSHD